MNRLLISILSFALFMGNISAMEQLIKKRKTDLAPALLEAINASDLDWAQELIDAGADVNYPCFGRGKRVLHSAAKNGQVSAIEFLLKNGANIEERDFECESPLFDAAGAGQQAAVELLIAHKADVNAIARARSVLWSAVSGNHDSIVQILLRAGANPNAHSPWNRGPLYTAAHTGSLSICTLLLNAGADVNWHPADGYRALWGAVASGNIDVCRLLLNAGAQAFIFNERWESLLFQASKSGSLEIVDFVMERILNETREGQCRRVNAFFCCLKRIAPSQYSNMRNLFKPLVMDIIKKENCLGRFFGNGKSLVEKIDNEHFKNHLMQKYFPNNSGQQ